MGARKGIPRPADPTRIRLALSDSAKGALVGLIQHPFYRGLPGYDAAEDKCPKEITELAKYFGTICRWIEDGYIPLTDESYGPWR